MACRVKSLKLSEAQFTAQVLSLAKAKGWLSAHFRSGMTSRTGKDGKPIWVTPVQGNGRGFPDLVLVRERIIFAELKTEDGKLSLEQEIWQENIEVTGVESYVWRPSDWNDIVEILTERYFPPLPRKKQ